MVVSSDIQDAQGATALDVQNVLNWLRGDTVVSGCAPTAGSGSLEVDVASGTARVNGTNVSVTGGTVTLSSGDSNPRKDLIYADSNGALQSVQGTAAEAVPSGQTQFTTYEPAPPDSTGITGAVIATVWVAANKSGTFDTGDIRDRRILSALDIDALTVGGGSPPSAGAIRIANNELAVARNNADSGDIDLIGTNTSDEVIVGDAGEAVNLILEPGSGDIQDPDDNVIFDNSAKEINDGVLPEPFSVSATHTQWADALSNEEIYRQDLQAGETLVIERIEFRQKGGGTSASASVRVRDTDAASTIGSQTLGGTTKDPGSVGTGNAFEIQISNSTGGAINASVEITGHITGA